MARKTQQEVAVVDKTDDEMVAEANALAVAAEKGSESNVSVRAVFNRMRNPYTGAVFTKAKGTDVNNLNSPDNAWTRDQIAAKVLEII